MPPPDRVSAAAARRARLAVVGRLAVWFTVVTLHQWGAFVIAGPGVGLGAQRGEIPAASAGMTDLFCAGVTELFVRV